MKKISNIIYSTSLLFFLSISIGLAQQPNLKEKVINKSFDNMDKNALISIENRFGDINMETSDNLNTVEIEIIIQSWHNNAGKAQSVLEQIQISDNSSGKNIDLSTSVPSTNNNNGKKGFKIIYNVKAPSVINIDYVNKYGSINMESVSGNTKLQVNYGALNAKDLNGSSNAINISYGSGEIDFIEKGSITTRYLSKLSIGQANELEIDDKYGNIEIGTGGIINGECKYSNLEINSLRKNLDFESDYGSIKVNQVESSFDEIKADAAYGSIKIGFNEDTPFNFQAETRYGSFKNNSEGVEILKSIEHNTSSEYAGYRINKDSGKNIYVKSAYGSIKFN